jgi:formate hydrogenlyase subunit 3/multisubunit Na+/H+ antiporter MnhD subunit
LQVFHFVWFNFAIMLTENEKKFIEYWKANRIKKKKVFKQLALGLPLSTVIVAAIFINFFSGWYKRADMELHTDPSSIIVIIIAALLIVVFITVFSVKHNWDLNEQKYRELLAKKDIS